MSARLLSISCRAYSGCRTCLPQSIFHFYFSEYRIPLHKYCKKLCFRFQVKFISFSSCDLWHGDVKNERGEKRAQCCCTVDISNAIAWQKLGKLFYNSVMVDVKLNFWLHARKFDEIVRAKSTENMKIFCNSAELEMRNDLQMSEFFYF